MVCGLLNFDPNDLVRVVSRLEDKWRFLKTI